MALIVIVDDDPTVRLIAREMLQREEHAIVEAADGDEALKLVASMHVDLVILDMLMPNKDGIETIIELSRTQPDVKIIAISSGGSLDKAGLLRTARLFGADETLGKPLRLDKLSKTVAEVLARPSGARLFAQVQAGA